MRFPCLRLFPRFRDRRASATRRPAVSDRAGGDMTTLKGKKGLVFGVADERSLAYACARHFRDAGADVAITYLNAKAERYVRPLADALGCKIALPCDVSVPGELENVFEEIATKWGSLRAIALQN